MKIDWNDILIQPVVCSSISSRKEIDCLYDVGLKHLPIFASPMDTVLDNENYNLFVDLGMNVCLPRGLKIKNFHESFGEKIKGEIFYSYGLDELLYLIENKSNIGINVLIDIANGQMEKLYELVKNFKKGYPNHVLMVGNIANPNTFRQLADAGADYIRVGIGNGAGCLTTQQTGVGYPMASLVQECYRIKKGAGLKAKIVADGGFKTYSDVIKALALGADYVMLGGILNRALESSGDMYWKGIKLNRRLANYLYKNNFKIKKKFRGMSTKEVQKKWGNSNLKTSEGVSRYFDVEYTLGQWTQNFADYLKSAMSYTDCRTLNDFIGKVNVNIISGESYKRFNK